MTTSCATYVIHKHLNVRHSTLTCKWLCMTTTSCYGCSVIQKNTTGITLRTTSHLLQYSSHPTQMWCSLQAQCHRLNLTCCSWGISRDRSKYGICMTRSTSLASGLHCATMLSLSCQCLVEISWSSWRWVTKKGLPGGSSCRIFWHMLRM